MCDRLLQLQSGCHHQKMLSAMWELKTTGTLCDVTVQVDYEGELEEFEAHQVVLAASSGYFKSILLAKDNIRKIFMCDIPPNAFSKFLEYVYSGKMEIEEDLLATVIQLAKHLDCQDLIDLCESLKTPSVDPEESPNIEENMQAEVKTKHVKKQIKRSSFKVPESPKGPELDVLDRKSSRLAGRRVSVEFPSEIPDESNVAEEEKSSLDTNDANGDTEMDSHYSLPDVPEEDSDEPEKLEKEKGSTKFRCMNCSRFFYYEKSYQKHLRIVHGVQLDTVFCCDICNQTFANRNNLKIHQRHVHNDDRLFSCDICSKSFKRKKDVTRHRRQVHEGGSNRHFCCVCGKSLSSKTALTLHERTHSGHKPYKCDICGSKFSQSSALKTHKRIHTGEKPFACDICGARFTQNHMLSYHRRCHTGEKPFMCEHCGKSFASKEYLKHHNRIHSGFRPYKCEMCERAFAQRNSLHQHMKTHTGERPYHCNQCDKQFTQLNALQRHQRIHTGEKPYMCSMCGRTFTDKSTVRRHTLTHDKLTPWKNFLVVLDGNVEDRASKPKVSQKKNKEPAPLDVTGQQTNADKVQDVVAVSGQPVTITGDWAAPGTIALVNHPSLGGLTVIHTDVTAGTQVQPLVTSDGTSVISLDGSSVGMPVTVPFTIPISVAHSISSSISVPITVPSVSEEVNIKAKDSETVLTPDPSIGHTQHPITEQEVGERAANASNIVEVSI